MFNHTAFLQGQNKAFQYRVYTFTSVFLQRNQSKCLVLTKVSFQRCRSQHLEKILRTGFRIENKAEKSWEQ
jgi:hypothetical protein